eukprot:gene63900-87395_t
MEINGVAHTFITAGDFERSVAFYRQFLPFMGLQEVADSADTYYCRAMRRNTSLRSDQARPSLDIRRDLTNGLTKLSTWPPSWAISFTSTEAIARWRGSAMKNTVVRFLSKRMRITPELHGERFFVSQPDPATGKIVRFATPLFLALVMINIADLVFAVDSVPAIFAKPSLAMLIITS